MVEGKAPAVTVVINLFNEEPRHLIEAIESVQAQTVEAHEIIAVEDGALRDYGDVYEAYPGIRVIGQANQGLAAARNAGLRAASGDFILFLDGDDRIAPHALAVGLQRMLAHGDAVMSYGAYRFIDADGRVKANVPLHPVGHDPYRTMLEGNCIGMHATVLYRRRALQDAGGFNTLFRACEDYELYLRMARLGPILHGPEILADYRIHGANMSGNSLMMLTTALRVLDLQEPFVRGDPERDASRRRGRAGWKAHYARAQLNATRTAAAKDHRQIVRGATQFLRMFSSIPGVMIKEAGMELLHRFKRLLSHRRIDLGQLRRRIPVSRHFGYDRGNPVDRRYIESFLTENAGDIRGRVLEIGDNAYTLRFGGARVETSEVLHVDPNAPGVTYCTDLTTGEGIPDDTFDCIVLTQTLHLVYEFKQAVATLHRLLKPGGVLLVTVPGVSSIDGGEWGGTWFWSFTTASLERLMVEQFGAEAVGMTTHGNVLTATAFLYGLAEDDLTAEDFAYRDPQFPVIVATRVVKGDDASRNR